MNEKIILYAIMISGQLSVGYILFGGGRELFEFVVLALLVTNGLFIATSQQARGGDA